MKFSERIGKSTPRSTLQVESIDDALQNSLWNLLLRWYSPIYSGDGDVVYQWERVAQRIAEGFLKRRIDELPPGDDGSRRWVRYCFDQLLWYETYDLLEFVVEDEGMRSLRIAPLDMPEAINDILAREGAGYRFISGVLTEITSDAEAAAVSEAIGVAESTGFRPVGEHLRASLRLLRRKPEADYRNATKEAISAVEATVKLITGTRGGGLKDALDKLGESAPLHGAFRDGFLKLYGYTSDGDGIRHALLKESELGFDEAKFMVVTCSAACYFLIAKADAAGLLSPDTS